MDNLSSSLFLSDSEINSSLCRNNQNYIPKSYRKEKLTPTSAPTLTTSSDPIPLSSNGSIFFNVKNNLNHTDVGNGTLTFQQKMFQNTDTSSCLIQIPESDSSNVKIRAPPKDFTDNTMNNANANVKNSNYPKFDFTQNNFMNQNYLNYQQIKTMKRQKSLKEKTFCYLLAVCTLITIAFVILFTYFLIRAHYLSQKKSLEELVNQNNNYENNNKQQQNIQKYPNLIEPELIDAENKNINYNNNLQISIQKTSDQTSFQDPDQNNRKISISISNERQIENYLYEYDQNYKNVVLEYEEEEEETQEDVKIGDDEISASGSGDIQENDDDENDNNYQTYKFIYDDEELYLFENVRTDNLIDESYTDYGNNGDLYAYNSYFDYQKIYEGEDYKYNYDDSVNDYY